MAEISKNLRILDMFVRLCEGKTIKKEKKQNDLALMSVRFRGISMISGCICLNVLRTLLTHGRLYTIEWQKGLGWMVLKIRS